eukprot:TRINITY_DN391_c0_g1_i1.p1 TRINITY_DN391_c0_g1~~TRINITY_DN391_c0_g1_i1.p1  ORF type:complete len:968 (+),score=197.90 TRINITY_DN391_c0_g1_i1:469-3372(+)
MMNILLRDSDCESYSESSDSDVQDDTELVYGGHAQSILSSLEESIGKIDDFLAFERGFLHGDIVCSITDPSGQMGRVVDVDMIVDMETISGETIKDVNSKKLKKFNSFSAGDYVVHGPWLGRVRRVVDRVTVSFDDGAKCEIMGADSKNLLAVSPNLLEDTEYPYYPGQRVHTGRPTIFKYATWLSGVWKPNRTEGIVCHVEVASVYVNWIASVMVGCDFSSSPPSLQDPKNVILLSCFPHANWQLGDGCLLPIDNCWNHQMGFNKRDPSTIATRGLIKEHKKYGRGQSRDLDCEQIYVIVKVKTKVDVLWQDGNRSVGLDPQTLLPVNNVGDHDFWPEQFVLEKGTYEDANVSSGQRLGIVKSVDAKERTVRVKWTCELNRMINSNVDFNEEIVSAYELIEHPDYSYCLGDVVFRLSQHSENFEGTLPFVQTLTQNPKHEDLQIAKVDMASDSLSYIGNVTGFKDGGIEVRWASGLISKVGPYEIVGIDRYEDPASTPMLNEDNEDTASEGMSGYDNQASHNKEKEVLDKTVNVAGEDCKISMWDATSLFLPQAAIGFLTNVAASLYSSLASTSLPHLTNSCYYDRLDETCGLDLETPESTGTSKFGFFHQKEVSECQNLKTEEHSSPIEDIQFSQQKILKQQADEVQEGKELFNYQKKDKELFSQGNEKAGHFKQFDMVDDYSDHHFVNNIGKGLSQVKRGWLKKVQQEWNILKKDLPDTIYVRVYEERIDLLRAAVVGAPGTPYHDGLFFFDILFPPEYPYEPPLVHYNSGGLRLNPNLYESGRVCLSLLKTWTGTGTEVWNPEGSTILQVLLSLQALVLNEKPYFNEAGYEQQIGRAEGEKNSMTYNENAFLLSCKSMLYLLRKPPKHFEALVEEHFCGCSYTILLACRAYMNGAPVGYAFGSGNIVGEGNRSSSTTGFKIMLAKLFPKLVSGFMERGIDCSQFLVQANGAPEEGENLLLQTC